MITDILITIILNKQFTESYIMFIQLKASLYQLHSYTLVMKLFSLRMRRNIVYISHGDKIIYVYEIHSLIKLL